MQVVFYLAGQREGMTDLRDLGLSSYEDQAYRQLLALGTATAQELADAAGIPMGRIYDVLNALEGRGMARSQPDSRPAKYIAVEPEIAIEGLVAARRTDLHEEIERSAAIGRELIEELEADPRGNERFWTAAIGTEDAVDLYMERLDSADERMILLVADVSTQLTLAEVGRRMADHLAAAVERGVRVSLLVDRSVVEAAPPELVARAQAPPFVDGPFEARVAADLHGSVAMIDRHELCVEVTDPLRPNVMLGALDISDPEYAARLESIFQTHWATATPLLDAGPAPQ